MRPITKALRPKFTLTKLQQAVQNAGGGAIYDPSSLWGAGDHLPRRNLLTYTEDFSNAIWTKFRGPTLTGGQLDPLGGSTATKIIPTSAATSPGVYQGSTAVAAGTTVRISFYAKAAEFSWVMIGSPAATGGVWFNVSTGTIGTITGGFGFTAAIEPAANGFFRCTLIGSAIATTFSQISVCDGNGSTAVTNSGTNGVIIWGAQLSLASTLDKSYQKITDWTTEQYAHAAQKNVPWLRRNLLTYSEDFSNAAAWAGSGTAGVTYPTDSITSPSGVTLKKIDSDSSTGYHRNVQAITAPVAALTYSIEAKADEITWVWIMLYDSTTRAKAYFNLSTGAVGTVTHGSASIIDVGGGVYRCSVTGTVASSAVRVFNALTTADNNEGTAVAGVAGNGAYFGGASLSVPGAAYQAVSASWDAQFAANAAAAGVALTMYQDSAGTTAVSGPDQPIGFQVDQAQGVGPELVTNGTFSSDTTGWTLASGTAVVESPGVKLTQTSGSTAWLSQALATVAGRVYKVSGVYTRAATNGRLTIGTTLNGTEITTSLLTGTGGFGVTFTATGTTTYLGLNSYDISGAYCWFDNISVRELPGYHAVQAGATGLKPVLRLSANGGWYLQRDLSDDNLVATFPAPLATGTCVHYRADELLTLKDENLTITGATNFNSPATDYGRIVLANPSAKDAQILKWLDAKRGVAAKGLGTEKSTNAGPYTDTTGWSAVGTTLSNAGGLLIATAVDGSADRAEFAISGLTVGATYLVTVAAKRGAAGDKQVWQASFTATPLNTTISTTTLSTTQQTVLANATSGVVRCYAAASGGSAGDSVMVSAVSVREVLA
jgi:hypothetical protein